MNEFGLLETDIVYLNDVFKRYDSIEEILVFGSRAKGNYKHGSDVDLAIKSQTISYSDVNKLDDELNEVSNLPYKFDLCHYENIQTPALKDHIDRVGVILYSKQSTSSQNLG